MSNTPQINWRKNEIKLLFRLWLSCWYLLHEWTGMTVNAIPFDESLGKVSNLSIVHAILAIDNTLGGQTHLIWICNAIYVPSMQHCFLCPNQAHEYRAIIDDIPIPLDHTGTSTFSMHTENGTVFPFYWLGPTAFLHIRQLTTEELEAIPRTDITEEESWLPYGNDTNGTHEICNNNRLQSYIMHFLPVSMMDPQTTSMNTLNHVLNIYMNISNVPYPPP